MAFSNALMQGQVARQLDLAVVYAPPSTPGLIYCVGGDAPPTLGIAQF